MAETQQVFRARRDYHKWVADETLEDYALRFTAHRARRFSAWQVSNTALGATAFLALEALGGGVTLQYGFVNALAAMLSVAAVIIITGLPISYHAARNGLDIDLLTRGAGFGYLGSTVTSLIYAAFTFIFFAIEAAILAMALRALFGIPLPLGYVICSLAVIPIVTHGITAISRFQLGTMPLWLTLQLAALAAVIYAESGNFSQWVNFVPVDASPGFNLLAFGAAATVLFAMVAQIGEQVDYLRFLPAREKIGALRWWTALLTSGPGWILIGLVKLLIGSLLAWLAIRQGLPDDLAIDPTHMYQIAFGYITEAPGPALILAAVMVIISQMKINVTNAYAGSIAWSNFFSRLTHNHPGRVVWLVFNVAIALMLMELGIYRALENVLGIFAIFAIAWLGALTSDLTINRWLKLRPPQLEFRRAHLYDINPVGTGAMALACLAGFLAHLNVFGSNAQALTQFIALGVAVVTSPLLAWLTGGRYYIARPTSAARDLESTCCICENPFEAEDMSHCPVYDGAICSLCCSLDARCMDACKPQGRIGQQIADVLGRIMPPEMVAKITSRIGQLVLTMLLITAIIGSLLYLLFLNFVTQSADADWLASMLLTIFFVVTLISGIFAWLALLAHESRIVAQNESNEQNRLLLREIEAHRSTDRELQSAKELAEAANLAKSRYLTGISHELRTPLQSILGYAQLLSRDPAIPEERRRSLEVIQRSSDYLTALIEGLLDISKIEAGRLELRRDQFDFPDLLSQLVAMFRPQAESRSIKFEYECTPGLPRFVSADEQRLRQILINLLSNAVKYTREGHVRFSVNYRNQVATFTVSDTGAGIDATEIERIFRPFERIYNPDTPRVSGTGLGLTIARLLTDIMGGDISVDSEPGTGSTFTVKLMLPPVDNPMASVPMQRAIVGFEGAPRKIIVVDDEASHRQLLVDALAPLGFEVLTAQDARSCLELADKHLPDLFLIDVSMPETNGLELAAQLRHITTQTPIIMISADAAERHLAPGSETHHDDYMVKPIKFVALQEKIAALLDLKWRYGNQPIPRSTAETEAEPVAIDIADDDSAEQLKFAAEIGHSKGVRDTLDHIEAHNLAEPAVINYLRRLAKLAKFDAIVKALERTS